MCHVTDTMARVDQLQVDPSPSGSVIVIAPLYLMILDTLLRWLDVQNSTPLGSIGVQLADCQGDQYVIP